MYHTNSRVQQMRCDLGGKIAWDHKFILSCPNRMSMLSDPSVPMGGVSNALMSMETILTTCHSCHSHQKWPDISVCSHIQFNLLHWLCYCKSQSSGSQTVFFTIKSRHITCSTTQASHIHCTVLAECKPHPTITEGIEKTARRLSKKQAVLNIFQKFTMWLKDEE